MDRAGDAVKADFTTINGKIEESLMFKNLGSMANKDLNDFGTTAMYGYWTASNRSTIANKPTDAAGGVFTIGGQYGRAFQFAYTDHLYFRYHGTGTDWTNWVQVV